MNNLIINIVIGIVVFVGFFIFWGRSSGCFKENGVIYEWWKNFKENRKNAKKSKD